MRRRGHIGISIWDYGQKDSHDREFSKLDPEFYRKLLNQQLTRLRPFVRVLEMQQEAHYLVEGNNAWSTLKLDEISAFRHFLVDNRFWAIHSKNHDADITDPENEVHREWSLKQFKSCIDFAFRMNSDAVTLHPGNYSEKGGNFWPKAEDALRITNLRRVTFEDSLRRIIQYFVAQIPKLEERLAAYRGENPAMIQDLRALFWELEDRDAEAHKIESVRYEISKLIRERQIPAAVVRYCKSPNEGVRLALENVDPPNFLLNTPAQHAKWHKRMVEIYADASEAAKIPESLFEKYRPGMVLDPSHYLNSQVIFKQDEKRGFHHLFEDIDSFLDAPFVTLPSGYPRDPQGNYREPVLNRFMRENDQDILYVHIAGCRRMDRYMTTHDPIKPFRTRMQILGDTDGKPMMKFATNDFDSERELNLEEVVQVVGFDRTWVPVVFDAPYEVYLSSCIHLDAYIAYLEHEYQRMHQRVKARLNELLETQAGQDESAAGAIRARPLLKKLDSARFYIRPHRQAGAFWKAGYEEAMFYNYDSLGGLATHPVNFLASVREENGQVWLREGPI